MNARLSKFPPNPVYGLSPEDYDEILKNQGGVCAICVQPELAGQQLVVDYDYDESRVRGLLCFPCHRFLHRYEQYATTAMDYLKSKFDKKQ